MHVNMSASLRTCDICLRQTGKDLICRPWLQKAQMALADYPQIEAYMFVLVVEHEVMIAQDCEQPQSDDN